MKRQIMPSNILEVKEANEKLLREIFLTRQYATKPELAALSGLSIVTVGSLVRDMLLRGEVIENGQIPSDGGRPSMQYAYRYDRKQAVIVYAYYLVGKDTVRVCTFVVNLAGKRVWERTRDVREIVIESFTEDLDAAIAENVNINGIYFGLPGEMVDNIMTINDFPALLGVEFYQYYQKRYSQDIYVENDINAMAYGNYRSHAGETEESLAGIYMPECFGPGAGFILNGAIYYGAGHLSGEIGRLSVPHDWNTLDYQKTCAVAENIAAVLQILCLTLAPNRFVIYGAFMTDAILNEVERLLEAERRLYPGLSICYDRNMEQDYEKGLICLALEGILNECGGCS